MKVTDRNAITLYYATAPVLEYDVPAGVTGTLELAIRQVPDPNTPACAYATATVQNGRAEFCLDLATAEAQRVCAELAQRAPLERTTPVFLQIYKGTAKVIYLQRIIDLAYNAGTLNGQPPTMIDTYVQWKTAMPTASADHLGEVVLFVGANTATYTKGHYYKCTMTGTVYEWDDITGTGATQKQADWNQTDTAEKDYIKNKPTIPGALSDLTADATHRTVTDTEKSNWNGKLAEPDGKTANKYLGTDAENNLAWKTVEEPNYPVTSVNGQTGAVVLELPRITVGACSSMGQIVGTGVMTLSWADPDDVVLNGATLTQWVKTILVRKVGSYPTAWNDGTTVAQTVRADGTKNRYRDTGYTDAPQGTGTVFYGLFSLASSGAWNNLTANLYPQGITSYSWYNVQAFVRAGTAPQIFPVGTVFNVPHAEYTHTDGTGLLFRVVGYDLMAPADESLTHSMLLDMVDVMFTAPYDAPEYAYALTADTVATTGKVYYTLSGTTYTALAEGTDWNPGDPVPVATWYEKNNPDRASRGNNNPVQSNLLQWLNSSGLANQWFTPQNLWDICTTDLVSKNGFCRNLDADFLSVVAPATLKTVLANVDGGGIATHTAKFFPLSTNQLFGTQTGENAYIPYYSSNDLRKKASFNGTYTAYFLRTSIAIYGYMTTHVTASGANFYDTGGAIRPYGISPACIIA